MTFHEFLVYSLWFIPFALLMAVPSIVAQFVFLRRQKKIYQDSPFFSSWKRLQTELADTLHHPHIGAEEVDSLLEKLETFTTVGLSTISNGDRKRLMVLLQERANDPTQTSSERTRAELLLITMQKVKHDEMAMV